MVTTERIDAAISAYRAASKNLASAENDLRIARFELEIAEAYATIGAEGANAAERAANVTIATIARRERVMLAENIMVAARVELDAAKADLRRIDMLQNAASIGADLESIY